MDNTLTHIMHYLLVAAVLRLIISVGQLLVKYDHIYLIRGAIVHSSSVLGKLLQQKSSHV